MKFKIKKISYLILLLIITLSLLVLLIIKFDYQANKIKYKDKFSNKVFTVFISLPDKIKSTLMIHLTAKIKFFSKILPLCFPMKLLL